MLDTSYHTVFSGLSKESSHSIATGDWSRGTHSFAWLVGEVCIFMWCIFMWLVRGGIHVMPDRIRFKLCTLVFRCLHGLAPRYLSDLCTPVAVHTHLRSSATLERSLLIPRTKTKTIGPRGFYFASSAAWNALPVHLRDPGLSLNNFKIKLKTHFFSWSPPPGDHVFCVRRARQHDNL